LTTTTNYSSMKTEVKFLQWQLKNTSSRSTCSSSLQLFIEVYSWNAGNLASEGRCKSTRK